MMIISKGRILGLVCTIATLAGAIFILQEVGSDENLDKLGNFLNIKTLFLLFALYAAHFLAEPLRWLFYTRLPEFTLQLKDALFRKIFACFNITALLSYSLPFKLGLPIRLFLLSHSLKLENKKVIKLMALDGLFNIFSWVLVSACLILFLPEIFAFISQYMNYAYILFAGLLFFILFGWLLVKKGSQVLTVLKTIPVSFILIVICTLIVDVLLYGVRHMVLVDILNIDIATGKVFIIGIIAVFAGIISTLPMGLGAYDASLVAMLGIYGVDLELGLIIAFSNRLGMILTSVILGVPSALAMLKGEERTLLEL